MQDTRNTAHFNDGCLITNNSTIDISKIYAQDQESNGRPFPPGTQSSQYLRPCLTANADQTFV